MNAKVLLPVALLAGGSCASYFYQGARNRRLYAAEIGNTRCTLPSLGGYPMTHYAKTLKEAPTARPSLADTTTADVCVIGGGFAGLHAALSLAERGANVVLLEAKRIGSGASGRNGGCAISGFHAEPAELAWYLKDPSLMKELLSHSKMGYDRLKDLITTYNIQCDADEAGCITMLLTAPPNEAETKSLAAEVRDENAAYGTQLAVWGVQKVRKVFHTARYGIGVWTPENININPLGLCFGLARACETRNARIYENSPVASVERDPNTGDFTVLTSSGEVHAKHVVLCTNAAPPHLSRRLSWATIPIYTGILTTKPIKEKALKHAIDPTFRGSVFDDRFGLAYYRVLDGNRFFYGGLATGEPLSQPELRRRLLDDLYRTFPSLRGTVEVDTCWQGVIHARRFPIFPLIGHERSTGMWYSLGFAGHGIVPTCAAGEILADAILGGDETYKMWSAVCPPIPLGGPIGPFVASAICDFYHWWDTRQEG